MSGFPNETTIPPPSFGCRLPSVVRSGEFKFLMKEEDVAEDEDEGEEEEEIVEFPKNNQQKELTKKRRENIK